MNLFLSLLPVTLGWGLALLIALSGPTFAADASVEQAIVSGDARVVPNADLLLEAAIETINASSELPLDIKAALFNLNPDGTAKTDDSSLTDVQWIPNRYSALLKAKDGVNFNFLITNAVGDPALPVASKPLGVIGTVPSRYIALGSNPMRDESQNPGSINSQMDKLLTNSFEWLTQRSDLTTRPFKVVLAQLMENGSFFDESRTRLWLRSHYPQVEYNSQDSCDNDKLAGCVANAPDLLILSKYLVEGDAKEVAQAVRQAMEQGIPVLYMHYNTTASGLSDELFSLLQLSHFGSNSTSKLRVVGLNPTLAQPVLSHLASIKKVLVHLKNRDYNFSQDACAGESCSAVTNLDAEFNPGAAASQVIMNSLDAEKLDIFQQPIYRLEKLLALLGDRLRMDVTFPMERAKTDDNLFLRSLYADHLTYYSRLSNPAQPDMGKFSRSDFSHITPVNKTLQLVSKVSFSAAGLYALPGKTMRITRRDSGNVNVRVFINTLRSSSTHEWSSPNGYNRPKFLRSPSFALVKDQTVTITSPYGGPIQLSYGANDIPVEIDFEQVGEHAVWRGPEDDATFAQKIDAAEYDWAELITDGFEVHSTLNKMKSTINVWGSAQKVGHMTRRYTFNYTHALAGFHGPNIDPIPEVSEFAEQHNIAIAGIDLV